jgi:hypothetical protein
LLHVAVVPEEYTTGYIQSVNGSSPNGHCSRERENGMASTQEVCFAPSSSVLFDGQIPTLTGLRGDTWASQLLTLRPSVAEADEAFGFLEDHLDYNATVIAVKFSSAIRLGRVEVVLFNCPQWGISITSLALYGQRILKTGVEIIGHTTFVEESCSSLSTVQLNATLSFQEWQNFLLVFGVAGRGYWVHLAEVNLHTSTMPTLAGI